MTSIGRLLLGGAALLAASAFVSGHAHAGPNLVLNGGFETNPGAVQMTTTNVADWSTKGYNFIFSGNKTKSLSLWNTLPGGAGNGFAPSPDGGFYLGADGAYQVGAVTQSIAGLIVGEQYAVSFYWAAGQQAGFTGLNTEQFAVSLGGGATQNTAVYSNISQGFSGWFQQTFDFQANGTTQVLSFLAVGTPTGVPPFSLLDGVSMTDVPEPATWAVLAMGLVGVAGLASRRRGGHAVRNDVAA